VAGHKKRPFYSVVIADARAPPPTVRFIEKIRHYDRRLAKDSGRAREKSTAYEKLPMIKERRPANRCAWGAVSLSQINARRRNAQV